MSLILLDTNVLVYMMDQNSALKQQRAREIFMKLEAQHTARLSAQVLAEFIQVCLHKLKPPLTPTQAALTAARFTSVFQVYPLTHFIVLEAARGVCDYKLPYYDAQIWAAARLNQIPVVFSEDFQDGMTLEGVRFVNPFTPDFDINRWIS